MGKGPPRHLITQASNKVINQTGLLTGGRPISKHNFANIAFGNRAYTIIQALLFA